MKATSLMTNVTSADPERLNAFYAEVVGLQRAEQFDLFQVGDSLFFVEGHSETHGPTKEPSRVLVSFRVTGLAAQEQRLKDAGVPCVRSQGREFWGGIISTFIDPDGNYFQLLQHESQEAGEAGGGALGAIQLIANVTSEDADALSAFYREVVGLAPDGTGGFPAGAGLFFVDGHSETRGPTQEPTRVLISFMVDDLAAEEQRLVAAGVECIHSQGREFWGGVISTFVDPDGNYFQLMEFKPEAASASA